MNSDANSLELKIKIKTCEWIGMLLEHHKQMQKRKTVKSN